MTRLLTVLMPALNEESAIVETIKTIPFLPIKRLGFDVEVLIIDGQSTDRTAELARSSGARVITYERGYGRQYKKGLGEARGEIIITGDADGTYPFENIPKYLMIFENNRLDFMTINRFAKMQKGSMRLMNLIGNYWLTIVTNLLFFKNIRDSQSGMWVIRRNCLNKLKLTSDGMAFSEEIKVEAFNKVRSLEVPGFYKKRIGKTKLSKIKDGFYNTLFLFKKRLKLT